jgi:N6-L-threonylcarbamoyladenine synthase
MLVLGIETTCDETAAAVVERHGDGRATILSNVVLSQIAEHAAFGGVVPEIAARAHVEALDRVIAAAMADAGSDFGALDGIAAAAGPGLIGGVIVGLTTAKAIALVHEKPLIAVNHLEAHALTARLTDGAAFPYCLFLASGGHTQIVAVLGVGEYVRLGTTRDDAIGEAFDKTAKLLGLGYPGGPRVEQEAVRGDAARFTLPRPMIGRQDADFSLSGLKTALRLEAEKIVPLTDQDVADLCASFQRAVVETVLDRLRHGLRMFRERFGPPSALVASGGVAANGAIRNALQNLASQDGVPLIAPPPSLCTDNGAMIAWAGAERLAYGLCDTLDTAPRARWPLAQVGRPKARDSEISGQKPDATEAPASSVAAVDNLPGAAAPLSPPPLAGAGQGGGPSASTEQVEEPPPQSSPASGGGGRVAPSEPNGTFAEQPAVAPDQPAATKPTPSAAA